MVDTRSSLPLAPLLALVLHALSTPAAIRYVKCDATGANDGSSWSNSFTTLQPAINAATTNDQVWIAQGTYTPTSWPNGGSTPREKHFSLKNGVSVYGGFSGTETNLADRDPAAHPVILSGDLDGNDADLDADGRSDPATTSNNAYHVFHHPASIGLTNSARLDSVCITGGRANTPSHLHGGGVFNQNASPSFTSCIMADNSSTNSGGAIYNQYGASPLVSNCVFSANTATYGGALYASSSAFSISDSSFERNTAAWGGAIDAQDACLSLTRCTFTLNAASDFAGALAISSGTNTLVNCTMNSNTAALAGGAVAISAGSAAANLLNCTLTDNSALDGGGLHTSGVSAALTNCVLWGNAPSQLGGVGPPHAIANCIIQGGYPPGTNIIDANPDLLPLARYGGPTPTRPPSPDSPAIDTGAAGTGIPSNDQRTFGRDASPDIGACEFQDPPLAAAVLTAEGLTAFAEGYAPTALTFSETVQPTYQWYSGTSGDTSNPITYATNAAFTLPPLPAITEIWVRIAFPGGSVDSHSLTIAVEPPVVFLSTSGHDAKLGTNWSSAVRTFPRAVSAAAHGASLWIAEGTYYPNDGDTANTNRSQAFQLKNHVAIYGGFAGVETNVNQRDPVFHPTVLSGDLDRNDGDPDGDGRSDSATTSNNAYHVFHHLPTLNLHDSALLSSVIVSGGNANGQDDDKQGGGMLNSNASPTLIDVTFSGNLASSQGGGLYNSDGSDSMISNCSFQANFSGNGGGALFNLSTGSTLAQCLFTNNQSTSSGGAIQNRAGRLSLTDCRFIGNRSKSGGAVYNREGMSVFRDSTFNLNESVVSGGAFYAYSNRIMFANCTFHDNSAGTNGGAVYLETPEAALCFLNCTFVTNRAGGYGGAVNATSADCIILHSTFTDNSANVRGGAISSMTQTFLTNCILWGNIPNQIGSNWTKAAYCIIQGGYSKGTNIIDADPLLKPLGLYGGATLTRASSSGSPAIDAGITGPGFPADDQRGFPRDTEPDIGACEFQNAFVSSNFQGPAPIGSQPTFTAFTDLDNAALQWFTGQLPDSQTLPGETNATLTTAPLCLGADFWVRVTGGGTNFDSATQPVAVRGTYAEWTAFHALGGPDADPGACPAHDGISNLIKFASGLDPHTPCAPDDYATLSMDRASNTISLTWLHSRTPTDITSSFRQSHDLRTWSAAGATPALLESTTAYDLWEITVPIDTNRIFLDIEVTRTSP